jgi:D-alanyl-D-alanine carboxypeptidase
MASERSSHARARWAACLAPLGLALAACGSADRRPYSDCTPTADESLATHPKSAQLDQLLADAVADGLPGVIMAVDDGTGTWIASRGVTDLDDSSRTLKTCHSMPIASITKTLVAAALMKQVDAGALSLDQTLAALLPAADLEGIPSTDRITVRQLLSHSSGIRHYPETLAYVSDLLDSPERSITSDEKLDYIRGLDLYAAPGTGYHYANTNYLLAARIAERLAGTGLARVFSTAILDPLGMARTVFEMNARLGPSIPNGYMDLYGDGTAHLLYYGDSGASGAGGAAAPAHELLVFSRAPLRDQTLVSASSVTAMTTSVIDADAVKYGFRRAGLGLHSWETRGGDAWGHTGEELTHRAWWHWWPGSQTTWIMLLNSNYGQFKSKADRLRERVLETLFP